MPPSAEEGKEDFDLLNPQGERYLSWTTDIPGRLIKFHLAASEEKRTIGTHIVEQRSEVKSPDNEKAHGCSEY